MTYPKVRISDFIFSLPDEIYPTMEEKLGGISGMQRGRAFLSKLTYCARADLPTLNHLNFSRLNKAIPMMVTATEARITIPEKDWPGIRVSTSEKKAAYRPTTE